MTLPSEASALGILWMMRLDKPLVRKAESRLPAVLLRAGPEHAVELAQAMGLDHSAPVLHRFDMGKHCYIARVEGGLAAYGWITFDEEHIGELGLSIRLNEEDAYIWDCGTLPIYRGQRLYPTLLTHMLGELQNAGLQRIWIGTDTANLPSQSGVALVGFRPVVDLIQAREGGFLLRGRPGVSLQDMLDAHYALFGNRDLTHVILPET